MSLADVTSARSSPGPEACPECDTSASVTSDLHKYQVACVCKPSAQYACADDPGPPPPAKTDVPPALPPRPPTSVLATNRRNNSSVNCPPSEPAGCRRRKYAWWCVGCGALAAALGGLLAAQHILLRAYTASPHHLETVPAAVPAAMLVLTGVCIMSLARRRNRYSYMIKVVGACCLVCALTCVLVTITTTVIHMNKLQTLRFCDYTKMTRTCTCFSMPHEPHSTDDDGVRCVFEGVTGCDVVHGALYWCLRGVFALSVTAVLVCIFSSMLAYQLLSHERKKMYWEQLELRCRSLYRGDTQGAPSCRCCRGCLPQSAASQPASHRFWAPGRIGNLYSPNPGTVRKNSTWSWFPWPRGNSQNSRSCRMGGVPQSGDSAYGFCETDMPQPNQNPNPTMPYEDRPYPANYNQRAQTMGNFAQNQLAFAQNQGAFAQNQGAFGQNAAMAFAQSQGNFGPSAGYGQEGFGESSGSFDAQTGVWGPPPPYSPQGRSGSRHHLHHQDPAAATLLHHHHIDVHRNSMPMHDHPNLPSNMPIQSAHTCRNSSYITHMLSPHLPPEMTHPELAHLNPELVRLNPELNRLNQEMVRLNPEINRLNQEMARLNPELARMYPTDVNELARLQEMARIGQESGRFNTLRGHLVPYPACQRTLGMSMGNLHRDCRLPDENMTIECLHQKSNSKVSDQSSDSCLKQGKENPAFQNDKHSPMRASMQDCHRGSNLNAESEVYFADVSSCCNVSVKADCCMNSNISALVGTIENHPESTSESDTGSFTLTRQQRPQPQTGSKRRPRTNQPADKHTKNQEKIRHDLNNSIRLTEQQIEQLNSSLCQRMNDSRMSDRLNESRISDRMNECRMSERLNDSRVSDRMNECRMMERMNESRVSERMNDSRIGERMNDSRMSERMNESRVSDRMNESRVSDRMNESRISEHSRMNDSRLSDLSRKNELRMSDHNRLDSSRSDHSRLDLDLKGSPKMKHHVSPLRNASRSSPSSVLRDAPIHPRQSSTDSNVSLKNNPDFFVPPPPNHSPLSPNTEESLLSDDEDRQRTDQVYSNEKPETSKCLGPDSQYEPVREEKEEIMKVNHHHCYSDTNTMDSGWQSGSEKHATD
ncbi:uncharacterized protein LOC105398624 [Plutella xylostella]|uniref:uncharacterized protein LOC105398624 n=1 Tax=Plutella xylostella TaxID=51655 RepID=UPI0020323E8A|nr:uncharacterized protein LOC105398624 [Plutella xylostella]